MTSFETKLWRLPVWFYYTCAVLLAVAALGLKNRYGTTFNDPEGLYLFATLAVAISSFLGGLGPGVLAAIICLVGGIYFFIEPFRSFAIAATDDRFEVAGFGIVWVLIAIGCDYMRRITLSLAKESRAVEEHRTKLDTLLGSISDGFFSVDKDWKITHANDAFGFFVREEPKALMGAYLWDYFSSRAYHELRAAMMESMRSGAPFELDIQRPGSEGWFQLRGYPLPDGMFVYAHDVTEKKRLEEERERMLSAERQARSDAESMNRLKDEFVATLSHELRTPLTTILGWTEVLQRDQSLDAKTAEGLAVIERSVRHQAQLIGDLLDMSRIAAGKLKLELEFVNLADTAYEAVELARTSTENKGIDLTVQVRDEQTIVRGDPQRLYQVLSNLLSNAIKFTSKGGSVRLDVFCADSSVNVSVTDTGEGIDAEFLPFLFDRFRQGDSSATRHHGGLGLGLSIVKQLVELHGGKVQAWSAGKGKGSRFMVTLPLAAIPSSILFEMAPPETVMPSLEGIRVLAVDDDEGTRELLEKMLTDAGAIVDVAGSGEAALEELEKKEFDVILSDIGMPEMDGYQFLSAAKERFGKNGGLPPALALTAFAHEKDFAASAEAGFVHHLTKPIDFARLVRTIHSVGHSRAPS